MSKTYLISLTPVGSFFFGGDISFTVDGKKIESSYIIRSSKFPQQTSLLGMLRFLILRNDNTIFDSEKQLIKETQRSKAAELIGSQSFCASGEKGDFGVIKSLQPCFLQKKIGNGWDELIFIPKDEHFTFTFPSICKQAIINGKSIDLPNSNFNPKDDDKTSYRCSKDEIDETDIFIEDITNGIDRDIKTGKTDDNSLFKKIAYRLKENYRFAFYADIEMVNLEEYDGQLVSIGGDNSQFVIGIKEVKAPVETATTGKRVILSSPAYLTEEDLLKVRFAITSTIPFKCMKTRTSDVKPYNKKNMLYGYSDKYNLYATGSIFYLKPEDVKDFTKKLKDHEDFYQIGYNHFKVTQ